MTLFDLGNDIAMTLINMFDLDAFGILTSAIYAHFKSILPILLSLTANK